MFKNVGKALMAWAWGIVPTSAIVFCMIGLFVARWIDAPNTMHLMFTSVFGVIGFVLGQIQGLMLYALGELVDSTTAIRRKLCGTEREQIPDPAPTPEIGDEYAPIKVIRDRDGRWSCPVCDMVNPAKMNRCGQCTTKVEFE